MGESHICILELDLSVAIKINLFWNISVEQKNGIMSQILSIRPQYINNMASCHPRKSYDVNCGYAINYTHLPISLLIWKLIVGSVWFHYRIPIKRIYIVFASIESICLVVIRSNKIIFTIKNIFIKVIINLGGDNDDVVIIHWSRPKTNYLTDSDSIVSPLIYPLCTWEK